MFLELAALFATAFLAATILPGSSEAALVASMKLGTAPLAASIAVATIGNTGGSLVNWALGRYAAHWRAHPRFPLNRVQFARCEAIFARYGVWALLFSWLPIVGDPLTVVAGLMRTPLWLFLPLVALGKFARYLMVAGIVTLF